VCRPPKVTAAAIRSAAEAGAALAVRAEPAPGREFRIEVEFDAAHLAAASRLYRLSNGSECLRAAYTADSAYRLIRTFKTVTTMAAAAVEANYG